MTGTFVMTYTAPNTFALDSANIMVTSPSGGFTSPINFTFDGTSTIISDPQFDLTGSDPDGVFHLHIQFAFMDGSVTSLGMNSYEKQNPPGSSNTITEYADTFGNDTSNAGSLTGTLTPNVVPEPSSIVLAGSALAIVGCGGWLRRRRATASLRSMA